MPLFTLFEITVRRFHQTYRRIPGRTSADSSGQKAASRTCHSGKAVHRQAFCIQSEGIVSKCTKKDGAMQRR